MLSCSDTSYEYLIAELLGRQVEPHTHRQPCNSVFMVNIASGMDLGRVRPTMTMTTTNDDDVVQRGGHTPANTESCSLGLQRTSLILDIHVMVKNGYLLTSIT